MVKVHHHCPLHSVCGGLPLDKVRNSCGPKLPWSSARPALRPDPSAPAAPPQRGSLPLDPSPFPEQEVGKASIWGKEGPSAKRKAEMLLRAPAESTPAAPRAQAPGGEPGAAPVRHRAARGWVGAGRGGAGGGCQGDGSAEPVSPAIRLAVEGPRWGDAALWGWTGELAARPRPATRPAGGTAACFSGAGGRMPPAVASFTTILYVREVTFCWSQPHLLPHKPRKAIGR